MRRRARPTPLLFILVVSADVVMASLGIGAGTAGAQQEPSAPPVAANTWAVSPGGDTPDVPGTRPHFSYELAPGARLDDSVIIWNYSEAPLTFSVYARDALTTVGEGFDLQTAATAPVDAGRWVTLATPSVTVPARSGTTIPISVQVPPDASPGDHAAGIVASLVTPATGQDDQGRRVVVDHRAGTRMYLRVGGPLDPSLVVEDITASYDGTLHPFGRGALDVTYTVRNVGNVRLRSGQRVAVTVLAGWAQQERQLDDLGELLPGSSVTRTERVTDVAPTVRVSAEVTLSPQVAAGRSEDPPGPSTRSASTWAVPWTLLALLAALVGLWRLRAWQRRRRAGRTGPAGGGGPGGGDPEPDDDDPDAARPFEVVAA